MKHIRHIILFILQPMLWLAGRLHVPYSRTTIKFKDNFKNFDKFRAGDVLLSKTNGEAANLLTPLGKWKHSAIVVNKYWVVESNQHGVVLTHMYDFIADKDKLCLLRSKTRVIPHLLEVFYKLQLGKLYDYGLLIGAAKWYCSELVFACLKASSPGLKFKRRKIWGEETVTPDDFYCARKHFDLVWEI